MRRTGLYPGTFDPVTNGHLDIMMRAAVLGLFLVNHKKPLATMCPAGARESPPGLSHMSGGP